MKKKYPKTDWKKIRKKIRNDWMLYLLIIPVLAWYLIFCYMPIAGGLSLSVREFRYDTGIWHSPFVGLAHFQEMLSDRDFLRAAANTIIISLGRIAFQMPCAILVAVFLNEIRSAKLKRTFQTVITFPHFISWVVLAGILSNIFGSSGIINQVLNMLGMESISPITSAATFRPFIWLSNIWKEVGWDSIIYLAAITSIDPGLYEAAEVDGAGRFQKIWHVVLPALITPAVTMFILNLGFFLSAGFDQVLNFSNTAVESTIDILDTYIYRIGIQGGQYSLATAVSLIKGVVGMILVLATHLVSKRLTGEGVW